MTEIFKEYTERCIFFVFKEKISKKRCNDVLIVIVIITIAVLFALCFIKVNLAFEYKRRDVNDYFAVSIFIFNGLIKYKIEIPKVDTKKKGLFFRKVKRKKKAKSEKKEKLSYGYILESIRQYRDFMDKYRVFFSRIFNYLRCKVNIKKLDFDITIGTDNAHHTAILTGLCWSAAGIIISFIHNNLNLSEKNISIKPDYMGKKLKVDLFCILNVRIGHIIIVGLIYLMHVKPFRKLACSINMAQNQTNHIL